MEVNPISIILVKSDSKGDRLLFRYPYSSDAKPDNNQGNLRKNPYSLIINEDLLQSPPPQTSNINKGSLSGLSDEVLSNLFAVKQELCEKKFELKVNDVRFVGHPTLFQPGSCSSNSVVSSDAPSTILIHVVFALHASACHSIVKCYYDLSKRLGIALRHEERRCGYVSQETKLMISAHDEVAAKIAEKSIEEIKSPFDLILERCSLSKDLKSVYNDLCSTGLVHTRVNKWIEVSFCLPHKVHQRPCMKNGFLIEPETIDECLQSVRPYHGLLLLVDQTELLECLPPDASPALQRLIRVYSPLKSLQTLAADADISLQHVFQLTGHLVYWAKATIIYPICENNVYVLAPDSPTNPNSPLVEKFSEKFSGESLFQVMSDFSLPTSLSQKITPLMSPQQQKQLVQMIAWLLQHHLLIQLHIYFYLMPTSKGTPSEKNEIKKILKRDPSHSEIEESSKVKVDLETNFKSSTETFIYHDDDKTLSWQKQLLNGLSSDECEAILKVPAASSSEDLNLLMKLYKKGYLNGRHHIEDVMYFENITRSRLLQILDKFSEVLVTCEIEQSVISLFYTSHKN